MTPSDQLTPTNTLNEDKQSLLEDLGLFKLRLATVGEDEGLFFLGQGIGTLRRHVASRTLSEDEAAVLRQELCDIYLTRWPHNAELFENHRLG